MYSSNSTSEYITKGNICTLMFIAVLFTIAKTGEQPRVHQEMNR